MGEVKYCTGNKCLGVHENLRIQSPVSVTKILFAFDFLFCQRELLRYSGNLSVTLLKQLCVLYKITGLLILNQVVSDSVMLLHVRAS